MGKPCVVGNMTREEFISKWKAVKCVTQWLLRVYPVAKCHRDLVVFDRILRLLSSAAVRCYPDSYGSCWLDVYTVRTCLLYSRRGERPLGVAADAATACSLLLSIVSELAWRGFRRKGD